MSLKDLLNQRNSVRRFEDKPVSKKDMGRLFWAGYGEAKLGRTVPSAGACYPLRLHSLERGEGINYFDAPNYIVITVDYDKITKRYGERGKRYALLEAGHVAQNIVLQAIELGLATVMIGAFRDGKIKRILETDNDPLYIIPVGKEKK